ncbi:prefoldin subunit 5 isoform X2 [Cryptotermes secundus]|uniref:prefoldin subunit 5 isoform X2 n=1 Tax=Cryptotermes secundus TaxID=105785 RepID=UPI000CD7CB3B|nr:prefoldin subunit 5 isoform X2 [Cryptotermes secundus]
MAGKEDAFPQAAQQIELSKLSLQQLTQLKQQLDQEVQVFQDKSRTLKMVQTKFQDSDNCLDKITSDSEGKTIMVPLTGSMYVPGKIANGKSVIIDIGTGYFVQKDINGAKDYFKRKVSVVEEHIEKVMQLSMEKNELSKVVGQKIQLKLQAQLGNLQQQSQQQEAAKS